MKIEEIMDDIDGLYLSTKKFISNSLKYGDSNHETLVIIAEELDKISTKLSDYKNMQKIFNQDDNEILDIPSMINKVHTEKI